MHHLVWKRKRIVLIKRVKTAQEFDKALERCSLLKVVFSGPEKSELINFKYKRNIRRDFKIRYVNFRIVLNTDFKLKHYS